MKLSNLLYAGMLSSLALVSCTDNDENSEWTGSEGVVFTTSIQSRVSGNSWNANDEVGIFMTPNGSEIASATAANKKYLAQINGSLVAAPGEGIYLPATGKVDFIAYYPYSNALSGNVMDVNVADQSKPGAIDLLYSNETKGVEAANGKTIALKFVRKMSKITLDMTKDETIESFEGLKVEMKGIATEGKFDLAKGTVKATDGKNTQAVAMNIGNVEASTAKATAIILPTAAATDQTKMDLTFTLAGKTFTHSIADLAAFEAGKNVTFGVKLSVNNGKPVVTVGNATIEDWVGVAGGDFDVNFDGEGGGTEPGEEKVLFQETFGKPEKNGKYWPYLTDYTGFDNPATMFENVSTEKASVRANEGLGNVWFPAGKEVAIAIKGINVQGAATATLECEVGANVYNAGESQDLNTLKVVCNQKEYALPSKIVSGDNKEGNKPFKLVIENVSISEDTRLEFSASVATNTYGLRLFSVKLYVPGEGGGTVDPTPEPEPEPEPQPQPQPGEEKVIFTEDFGTPEKSGNFWPNVSAKDEAKVYKGWSNKNLTFSDPYMSGDFSNASVRTTSTMNGHVWFAGKKESALKIEGFDTSNYTQLKLTFKTTGNAAGKANILTLKCGEQAVEIPATDFTQNNYVSIELTNLPESFTSIEFKSTAAANTIGMRVDDVTLSGVAK